MDANIVLRQVRSRRPRFPGEFSSCPTDMRIATTHVLFNVA